MIDAPLRKLGDICEVASGGTPKRSERSYWDGGTIPWVKISDIKSKYIDDTEELITEDGLEHSSAKLVQPGTVLYSIFASIGATGILAIPATTNQAIAAVRPKDATLSVEYLYHWLKAQENAAKASSRGVAQNNINLSILRSMELPVPTVAEQESVTSIFDAILQQQEYSYKQLNKLDDLVKSRFIEMFGNDNWSVETLESIADVQGGLTKNKKRGKHELQLPYLRVANVLQGKLDLSEMLSIGLTEAERDKTLLQAGDMLFVEGNGSRDQIGRSAIWDGSIGSCVHQNHLIRARLNERVLPVFALAYFSSPAGRDQIVAKAVSTSGLFTLSTGKIKALEIPVPPLTLQQEFATFVAQVDKLKVTVQQQIDKLQLLYDSLAQEYFGGE